MSGNRHRRSVHGEKHFDPREVPEILAGYWWEAANTSGFGTTDFRVLEGNGNATFDLIQATVANQPTALAENGGVQFRMRKAADPNPSLLATENTVQAGWTGPTYVGIWARIPDSSGDVTSAVSLLLHNLTTGNQRRINVNYLTDAPDTLNTTLSDDGLAHATYTAKSASTMDAQWQFIESIIDINLALGGSSPGDVVKHYSNFQRQTLTTVPTGAPLVLFDALAKIFIATQNGAANTDTTDWVAAYYANGIPSLANRVRLANRKNPTGILLAA